MRKEFLANAIANIGDEYVEKFARVKKRKTIRNIFGSIGAVGIAAAIALVIGLNTNKPVVDDYSKLPKIALEYYEAGGGKGGNTGRTGLLSKDRPPIWNDSMKIKTMPVYMSESTAPNHEKMLKFIKSAAAALGISENELEIMDNYDRLKETEEDNHAAYVPTERYPTFEPIRRSIWQSYSITATAADGTEFILKSNYSLLITFGQKIELPAEYNFSADAPTAEREKALSYLAERFKELTGYEKYTTRPERAGYKINAAADTDDLRIANDNLNTTLFGVADGKLCDIMIHSAEGCSKLGDYPIISVEEAEEILKSDVYRAEERLPEDAEILQVELCYENLQGYTAIIPYYDFYVRSDETDLSDDTIRCDLYRVSAIPSSFFEGVETGDYGTRA